MNILMWHYCIFFFAHRVIVTLQQFIYHDIIS